MNYLVGQASGGFSVQRAGANTLWLSAGDGSIGMVSTGALRFSSTTTNAVSSHDAFVSRGGVGQINIGTTGTNALGSLNLAGIVANGAPSFFSGAAVITAKATGSTRGIYVEPASASLGIFVNNTGVVRSGPNAAIAVDAASGTSALLVRDAAANTTFSVSDLGVATFGGTTLNPANGAITLSQTFALTLQTSNMFTIRHGNNDLATVRPVSASGTYSPAGYGALGFANSANATGVYMTPTVAGTLAIRTAAHGDAAIVCGAITASGVLTVPTSIRMSRADLTQATILSQTGVSNTTLQAIGGGSLLLGNTSVGDILSLSAGGVLCYQDLNLQQNKRLFWSSVPSTDVTTAAGQNRWIIQPRTTSDDLFFGSKGGHQFWAGGGSGGTSAFQALHISYTGEITANGSIQETPRQSTLNPTVLDIPSGKSQRWYNSALNEVRDWVNIGGTLYKSAAYTT
jgi:hypothetical protein